MHKALRFCPIGSPLIGRVNFIPLSQHILNTLSAASHSVTTDVAENQDSNTNQLLGYWHCILDKVAERKTNNTTTDTPVWKSKDMQDLLHTALRVRHGRVSGVMPEQLLATFMQVYKNTMGREDRRRLFLLICQDFGVQGSCFKLDCNIVNACLMANGFNQLKLGSPYAMVRLICDTSACMCAQAPATHQSHLHLQPLPMCLTCSMQYLTTLLSLAHCAVWHLMHAPCNSHCSPLLADEKVDKAIHAWQQASSRSLHLKHALWCVFGPCSTPN